MKEGQVKRIILNEFEKSFYFKIFLKYSRVIASGFLNFRNEL